MKSAVIYISVIAALGGFLFGFDTAVISGTVESIKSPEFGFGLTAGDCSDWFCNWCMVCRDCSN